LYNSIFRGWESIWSINVAVNWNTVGRPSRYYRKAEIYFNQSFIRDFLSSKGKGTEDNPWILKTPPGTSEFKAYKDEASDPTAVVVWVGKIELKYQLRCIEDLYKMLKAKGDWMPLGSADEQKPAEEGTIEAWGRSPKNPVGGWYGIKKGLRGRFGNYIPPILEALGLAEVEHNPRNNRMRAI
jgi:hypothetical protein